MEINISLRDGVYSEAWDGYAVNIFTLVCYCRYCPLPSNIETIFRLCDLGYSVEASTWSCNDCLAEVAWQWKDNSVKHLAITIVFSVNSNPRRNTAAIISTLASPAFFTETGVCQSWDNLTTRQRGCTTPYTACKNSTGTTTLY
jgi:hypothetical protein